MTETLANGYSSESTQRELFNEYQHDRVKMVFKKSLHPCALEKSCLSIERVNLVPSPFHANIKCPLDPCMGIILISVLCVGRKCVGWLLINILMFTTAKSSLLILIKSFRQKHICESI